jgi:hypothetical protein
MISCPRSPLSRPRDRSHERKPTYLPAKASGRFELSKAHFLELNLPWREYRDYSRQALTFLAADE